MSNFTPGPWQLNEDFEVVTKNGVPIALVFEAADFPCVGPEALAELVAETEANLRLITAAPTLFDVVQRLQVALASAGVSPVQNSVNPVETLLWWMNKVTKEIQGERVCRSAGEA